MTINKPENRKPHPICRLMLTGILALAATAALALLIDRAGIPVYSVLYLGVFALEWRISLRFIGMDAAPRAKWTGGIYGFVFALALFTGAVLSHGGSLCEVNMLLLLVAAAGLGPVIAPLYLRLGLGLDKGLCSPGVASIPFGSKAGYFFACLIGFFLCWLPVFLAYYPGLFAYDVGMQIPLRMGSYYTMQPLLHTLLLQAFYALGGAAGSYTTGMACYTVFQMLLLSAALARMMLFLLQRGLRKGVRIGVFAFFALMPLISILAVSITKDILFSAAMLLLFIQLCICGSEPDMLKKPGFCIGLILLMTACGLLRGNGGYAVMLAVLVGLLSVKKPLKGRFALVGLVGVVVMLLAGQGLTAVTKADAVTKNQMLSVPYQQIARVHAMHGGELSMELDDEIHRLIPDVDNYDPYCADPLKGGGYATKYPADFIRLYLRLLPQYPARYVEAFLMNMQGLWYLDDVSCGEIYGKGLSERLGYLLTNTVPGFDVEHTSFFPALETLYERLISNNEYQKLPVLGALFSLALYFWLFVLGLAYAAERRAGYLAPALALIGGLLLTSLLGPCMLPRYALPYILPLPALYAALPKKKA